jgi:hypothetical protein
MDHAVRNVFRLAQRYSNDLAACKRQFCRIFAKPRQAPGDGQTLARILLRVLQLKGLLFEEIQFQMNQVAIYNGAH